MSQIVAVDQESDLLIVCVDSDGLPVTGLVFGDVTCAFRKEGGSSFTSKSLDGTNFTEIGSGVYTVTFSAANLDTLGSFIFTLNGSGIRQAISIVTVEEADSDDLTDVSVSTCIISGHIFGLDGRPAEGVAVSARVLGKPEIFNNVGFTDSVVSTRTASNGQFLLELTKFLNVEISIPDIDYTRRFVVPDLDTVDLFSEVT